MECVESGTAIDSADYDGRTVLHLASSEGHLEMVPPLSLCLSLPFSRPPSPSLHVYLSLPLPLPLSLSLSLPPSPSLSPSLSLSLSLFLSLPFPLSMYLVFSYQRRCTLCPTISRPARDTSRWFHPLSLSFSRYLSLSLSLSFSLTLPVLLSRSFSPPLYVSVCISVSQSSDSAHCARNVNATRSLFIPYQ